MARHIGELPHALEREVNDRGACVDAGEEISFFPWSSVVRIDLGHSRHARGLKALYSGVQWY
jgi:hypothetical protein